MAIPDRVRSTMKRVGVTQVNKPKRTPDHSTKSHVVMAEQDGEYKLIRFGQQGVRGSPRREGESQSARRRREAFRARHNCSEEKNKLTARYWACNFKW